MKFKKSHEMNDIEKTAVRYNATLSNVEYGALHYMNLDQDQLNLIFDFEKVKFEMLEQRREDELERKRRKYETAMTGNI